MIDVFKKFSKNKKDSEFNVKEAIVVGFYEDVLMNGFLIRAKVDTGASTSSIDSGLADYLELGPVFGSKTVISSHGRGIRPLVQADIVIAGKRFNASFNIVSRHHLRYPLLIGKNILRKGFIIDPKKKLKKHKTRIIKNTRDLHFIK